MKTINLLKGLKIILLSAIVVLIAVFIMSYKSNLDIDEAYTYGLANNSFQMNVESFKEYTGEELLLDYTAVKDGKEFDAKNVFFNQTYDTHPPLYFLLVNFICSINKLKFSMWYGLIINIIFLIIIFWNMSYLLNIIINNKIYSIILSLIAFILYGFINSYTFIRMYVMLSAISMTFVSLIVNYITSYKNEISDNSKKLDVKFLILFYLVCVLGILTQYHFMIIAGFFSLVLAIYLIQNKNYRQLIATFIVGILSIATSFIIFPPMFNHIFNRSTSTHAISSFASPELITERIPKLIIGLNKSFFGMGIMVYVALVFIGLLLLVLNKKVSLKPIRNIVKNNKLYFIFLLSVIFYFIIICLTIKFSFQRYLYNIYPLIYILIISSIYIIFTKFSKYFAFIPVVFALVISLTTNYKNSPTSLNIEDAIFEDYLYSNRDTKMILLYRTVDSSLKRNTGQTSFWKVPSSLYIFQHMKNMTFVDISNEDALAKFSNDTIEGYKDVFLVIFNSEDDNKLINLVMAKNEVSNCERVYFTTYYHMYRLQ